MKRGRVGGVGFRHLAFSDAALCLTGILFFSGEVKGPVTHRCNNMVHVARGYLDSFVVRFISAGSS